MVKKDIVALLRLHGIHPSAQRVAVGEYVLDTEEHPSADEAWSRVKKKFPRISRATVYNTLNLFVKKGLLHSLALAEGKLVFDPKMDRHHHFIDESTGKIYDLPWESLSVSDVDGLHGFEVRQYQVVVRGKKKST
ncbi:MAG TPA: transcriptional repressor [Planctomycetota bacterium]|nr:transcriptional repressor [Planctomycetota bacterium]